MASPYSGPKQKTLRKNLANLVTEGLQPYWIAEIGGDLLTLEIVCSRVPPGSEDDEEAVAKASVEVLTEAVAQIGSRKYKRLLNYVLPLDEDYSGKSVKDRRIAAGENLKDGKKTVKWGTIRTHHEPKALDQLAKVLVKMEAEYRGETSPWADTDTD